MITLIVTMFAMTVSFVAMAAGYIVVTPTNQQGWTENTRDGGDVNFVVDPSAPSGVGALQLTTPLLPTTAYAQYVHETSTPLANVSELSYYTKQVSAPFPGADPAYQLATLLRGTSGFTTLVFEPYQNPQQGPVVPNVWQQWDVDQGLFWSTRTVACSNGTIVGTRGGPATYTLSYIKATCPEAFVFQYIVNIGSNNPGYNVETDLFDFNGTTYDFEPYQVANNKDQCKNGGFNNVKRADGSSFKNQGDCVSYTNNGR